MKRFLLISTIACALFAMPASATCAPPGWFVGAGGGYQWIANGLPTSTNCWNIGGSGSVSLVSTPGCTYSTAKAFDMHYGARVSQEFTVPNDQTENQWSFSYLLTMQDPHNDGWWNRLKATVYDVTTGQTLATETYWGNQPDITCSLRSMTFTGNLAGHTLQVIFADGSAYSDTYFRIRSISLIQTY
jgi:hypothetical protein